MALAHEWLDVRAGSEKTFEVLAAAFPSADLYALSDDLGPAFASGGRTVRTTFVPRLPLVRSNRALALPLMPLAWRTASRRRYDVVVTSSHACVKGFRPAREALHLCYCYAPMRYVWDDHDVRSRAHRLAALGPAPALRAWDRRSAGWVDGFAAISSAVQARIGRYYERESVVIHPPVDTSFYRPDLDADAEAYADVEGGAPLPDGPFVLTCSRFIPYKRLDLAIGAADRLGLPVVVAGHGPGEAALREVAAAARVPVTFEVSPSDERLRRLYRAAAAFVFPALEDFGIVAVEAQACGTPVVGLAAGGSLDTVLDGTTGALVAEQEVGAFAAGLERALAGADRQACVDHAATFSREAFTARVRDWVAARGVVPPPPAPTVVTDAAAEVEEAACSAP
ncbi:MAG TPA: glycosyltransferase [Aquihabitans sp.]|jgi:glycosyltransferase involved in cell wall biosynthesis|nr:glycosyltransferase [Aquihabitans sp.]